MEYYIGRLIDLFYSEQFCFLQVSGSYNRNHKTTVWLGSQAVGHAHICWVAALSDKP